MSRQKNSTHRGWRSNAPRLIAGAVGVVLLSAAFMKMMDMDLFIRQMRDYGIISNYLLLSISARGLIALECTLGVGLLVFYRPKLTLLLTSALLLIFVGATGWAWLTDATIDCGCFGAWVKRTPKEAVLEGLIVLALTVIAWAIHRPSQKPEARPKAWAIAVACLAGLILPLIFGSPVTRVDPNQTKAGDILLGDFQIEGLDRVDLAHGDYLLVLMDTECSHCRDAVAELNWLAEDPDLPEVIGLSSNGEDQLKTFRKELQVIFPIGLITEEDFWRLLGDGDVPRTFLVRDRVVQEVWDTEIPDDDTIKSIVAVHGFRGSMVHGSAKI
jgi:uncharacterized membrane protein YphA (DoxX/SURF4 family)